MTIYIKPDTGDDFYDAAALAKNIAAIVDKQDVVILIFNDIEINVKPDSKLHQLFREYDSERLKADGDDVKIYTVLEWFENAKAQGAGWAQTAIEFAKKSGICEKKCKSLKLALQITIWQQTHQTPEFYEKWRIVSQSHFVQHFKYKE